ncbi:hypothetical protein NDU88_005990 [Pleurodeles waltl]|uniref:Uncharacterized protein n=1 Tax=Pleurodeles waltl TaxID=8319 RepID=A0AAV7WB53_PLEWA|nr:hypothetical protein NDU88_005990 [Pleurodeles waltl]
MQQMRQSCGKAGPPGQPPAPLNQPPRCPDPSAPWASGDRLSATSSRTSGKYASESPLARTGPAPHQPTERLGPLACAPGRRRAAARAAQPTVVLQPSSFHLSPGRRSPTPGPWDLRQTLQSGAGSAI